MSPAFSLTRREAVKLLGTGAVLAGLGLSARRAAAQPPRRLIEASTPYPFVLPKLGYAFAALEPEIDARTMELHYTKHHQAYVTDANQVLAGHAALQDLSAEDILANLVEMPEAFRDTLRHQLGGHLNHAFFWRIIAPVPAKPTAKVVAESKETKRLRHAIKQRFGSEEVFRQLFTTGAMNQFGSGWVWLSVSDGALVLQATPEEDSPLSDAATPIIGLDLWEHAYYLRHQNARAAYVEAFWRVLNWEQAGANYASVVPA